MDPCDDHEGCEVHGEIGVLGGITLILVEQKYPENLLVRLTKDRQAFEIPV